MLDAGHDREADVIIEPSLAAADDILLTTEQVANRYQQEVGTLANARARGEGLPWVKTATGAVRYKLSDVLASETAGNRGFSWQRLAKALEGYKGLTTGEAQKLLTHLKEAMRE